MDAISSDQINIFHFRCYATQLFDIFRTYFHMYRASFPRKSSAMSLCKSIKSAIQWFQIHHEITFVTIHNPAVYLSGASVSISPTLVPRLLGISCQEGESDISCPICLGTLKCTTARG